MERSDVIVTGFRLNAAEPPAKVLQAVLGLGEAEAKALSKRFPCVVLANVEWAEAERVSMVLRDAGAYAKLRPAGAKSDPPGVIEAPRTLPPAQLEIARVAPKSQPAPAPIAAAEPSLPVAAPVPVVAAAASAPLMMTPAAKAALELGHAPTLFSAPVPAQEPATDSRTSLPYALGELEIVPTKSTPAPAMPAPKSQPAPAMHAQSPKSQPAPAIKSQPAPAHNNPHVEATGLRMLEEGFGEENVEGPALELDYGTTKTTGRVEYKQRGKIHVREKDTKRRGFWATLLLPIVLLQAAVPHALALTGVAAASGAAVYIARTSAKEKAGAAEASSLGAEGKQQPRSKGGLMGLLDEITGGGEDKTGGEVGADQRAGADGTTPYGDDKAGLSTPTEATHPFVRMAPKAMEPAIASILRQRFRGLHKVMIEWPEGEKPEGACECMLLEQEHAGKLKELMSTGRPVAPSIAVREQLQDHIGVLRAANADTSASYIPICLAN